MYGLISAEWGHAQERYYQTMRKLQEKENPTETFNRTSYTWAMKLIAFLWCQAKILWKLRNQELHDPTGEDATNRHRQEVERKVAHLYTYYDILSPSDRGYLNQMSLQERLNLPTHELETWYKHTHEPVISCALQQEQRRKKGYQDIRKFCKKIIRQKRTDHNHNDMSETSSREPSRSVEV